MAKVKKDAYVWFSGETLAELREQLNDLPNDDAGLPLGALEIHGEGADTTLHVVRDGVAAQAEGGLNEAHICPPFCR